MLVVVLVLASCGGRSVRDAPISDGGADADVDTDSSAFVVCGDVYCAAAACCDGTCVNLASDSSNCGACDDACSSPTFCSGGDCVCEAWVIECNGVCAEWASDCDGDCTDVQSSREHCGACDSPCASGSACISGTCIPGDGSDCGSCPDPSNGCCDGACVDLDDSAHCGACDVQCDEPKAPDCVDGVCTVILI